MQMYLKALDIQPMHTMTTQQPITIEINTLKQWVMIHIWQWEQV